MFNVSATDLSDLLDSIDLGWAKEVPSARFISEDGHTIRFFHIDGRVFREDYNDGSSVFHEVEGEDLGLFRAIHMRVAA